MLINVLVAPLSNSKSRPPGGAVHVRGAATRVLLMCVYEYECECVSVCQLCNYF